MKNRKNSLEKSKFTYFDNGLLMSENEGSLFFEIGNVITDDTCEAVSILMKTVNENNKIWNSEINKSQYINPIKSLYWLTGGDIEWKKLPNYKKPWSECHMNFSNKYEDIIINIFKKSKTLGDIRKGFIENLNLPKLYDYAVSIDLI
jgi:hypothetical protein